MTQVKTIAPAEGKLGILLVGLGAVSTTFIAGVEAIRRGQSKPIGSLTQMGTIRLGQRSEKRSPLIKDFVPLAKLEDIVFGAWDVFEDNAYEAAKKAAVLNPQDLEPLKEVLCQVKPMKAAFDRNWVKKLDGKYFKTGETKRDLVNQLIDDIRRFEDINRATRSVVVWCGSTEVYIPLKPVHMSLEAFEKGLDNNDADIAPSMLYAYAALSLGIPYANGAPNLTTDTPALLELARRNNVPLCGKDFKTGQTLMKTILAPGFKARQLGISGWFSTNILGNRDGEVLDDPESFKSKEVTKLGVLDTILQPELNPDLYGNMYHKVRINYYPPRGDNKEGWDNIDIFGWMGYPMQIKVDFLCRDSILAAPLVLDLALFMDLSKRAGLSGIQEWLSFYYKCPMVEKNYPEHNIFIQEMKLKNTLRFMMGEDPVTHVDWES
ncbi:MAG: inositol-3-phosphate synthase [Deltaproteobacteria bacterium CG11_big_fil_rev_8_21_14_0_20_42_23]|nr:MAG: inositol-3-phosphate synthase [Deltaproteobacteria bacterium CG11_big_fil_rev_8_21_14_0_20_42_23]PJC64839.1 MAG: inositol-3-phosphate synthase [Deltaproteobacteria bacterium CG_4_9_14_0_2_um_filter_42_21]